MKALGERAYTDEAHSKFFSFAPAESQFRLSDNECNSSYDGFDKTVQGLVDEYRSKYNRDFWVHGVDMQGYGSQQFCGSQFNLIAGWSDSVLPFINLAERGIGSLVSEIAKYEIK